MSRIIFSCNNGLATEGIVAANEPIYKTKIFIDDPQNLIGFRTSLKQHTDVVDKQVVEYFEIGYFMEMIYEGQYDAFKVLKIDQEHIDFQFYDFDILRKREEDLVSMTLVENLVKEADDLFKGIEDPEKLGIELIENESEFVVQKLAYNNKNAYICLRNLMVAENVLNTYKFELGNTSQSTLQGVRDGRFSLSAINDGYDTYKDKINKLLESSNMPIRPDYDFMNKTLYEIRNVEIKSLNIETIEKD